MNLKKLTAIAACLIIVASGCGGGGQNATPTASSSASVVSSDSQSDSSQASAPGQISAEKITIKIFAPKDPDGVPFDEMQVMAEHSEKTNIFVQWEQTSYDQQDERFNVILASNELPDMFWNLKEQNYLALRAAKVAVPIQDYLTPEAMPNFTAVAARAKTNLVRAKSN